MKKKMKSYAQPTQQGIHTAIGEGLSGTVEVTYATLDDPEHGLSEEVLNNTDVLIWWGHKAHDEVQDEIVARVQKRVWQGMGLNRAAFRSLLQSVQNAYGHFL